MQALVVVVDHDLPVRLDVVDDRVRDAQLLEVPVAAVVGRVALRAPIEERAEVLRFLRRAHEDETVPHVHRDRVQRVAGAIEALAGLHVRGADERPRRVEGPRVVRALDHTRLRVARTRVAQPRPAMRADVEEPADRRVPPSDDDHALRADLAGDQVPGGGELLLSADADPFGGEQVRLLGLPHLRGVVGTAGEGRDRFPGLRGIEPGRGRAPEPGLGPGVGEPFGNGAHTVGYRPVRGTPGARARTTGPRQRLPARPP